MFYIRLNSSKKVNFYKSKLFTLYPRYILTGISNLRPNTIVQFEVVERKIVVSLLYLIAMQKLLT